MPTLTPRPDPHADCWSGEPCCVGRPDECPPHVALAKRDIGAPWSALVMRHESGGLRHYFDGEPVHCGDTLELQAQTVRSDDLGEFTRHEPTGVVVRYEVSMRMVDTLTDKTTLLVASIFATVGGHTFGARVEPWMRFRWPR
jgi:hypothetical protein